MPNRRLLSLTFLAKLAPASVSMCTCKQLRMRAKLVCRQLVWPLITVAQCRRIQTHINTIVWWMYALIAFFSLWPQAFWPPSWPRFCTRRARSSLWRLSALLWSWWRSLPVSCFSKRKHARCATREPSSLYASPRPLAWFHPASSRECSYACLSARTASLLSCTSARSFCKLAKADRVYDFRRWNHIAIIGVMSTFLVRIIGSR